jgi:hypothetical protein
VNKAFENYKIYIKFGKDIGPVQESIEMRWNKFSDLTNKCTTKRLFEKMRGTELEN